MDRVFIAMSGGVDSSLSAALLKEQGYDVIGLFISGWEDELFGCQAKRDLEEIIDVCGVISIPYYVIDLKNAFLEHVFEKFLSSLISGLTPNPDISCNQHIKFRILLEKALAMGGKFLATGHYCQLNRTMSDQTLLYKGADPNKDQSYFLYAVSSSSFENVQFPIGELHKKEVRTLARKYYLPNHDKKDSVGICFVENKKFSDFISHYIPINKGPIISTEGEVLGEHNGLHFFTLGQRKGLRIGGKGPPWFVIRKDIVKNTLLVVQGKDHHCLFANQFSVCELNWLDQDMIFPLRCHVKTRYRQDEKACLITPSSTGIEVFLDFPQRAITPGQAAVFYRGNQCLGGGVIQEITLSPDI